MTASLTEAIQGLKISNNSPSSGTSSPEATIKDALNDFIDAITAIFERIPAKSEASSQAIDAGDVAFFRDAQHLVAKSKILADIAERAVIDSIIARGNPYGELHLIELLENFDTEIRAIGSEVAADQTISAADVPWKVAEKCYMEAFQPSGMLHVAQYFDNLENPAFEAPDPDYESEAYYDYEDRLNDPVYVKASHQRSQLRREQQRALREKEWLDFWTLSLSSCPGGPTLFRHSQAPEETPRYLFRAYDKKSHSFSDLNIVASWSERYGSGSEAGISRDITDMDPLSAANMLSAHLDWKDFGNANGTNLVSWSSSMLFVIQYAIFRSSNFSIPSKDIYVIAVDTSKFPPGQFAQDMFLIDRYGHTPGLSFEARKIFKLRWRDPRWHNGEFLSQGRLNHAGRSSTFSLQDLTDAGLYQLYPEFQEEQGRSSWASRALALRGQWTSVHTTTAEEFQHASQIATRCFGPTLRTRDIRILFLAFRRRKLGVHGSDPDEDENKPPGPIETYRYSRLAESTLQGAGSTRFVVSRRRSGCP